MLETPHERVKMLKAGISTKTIEQLYLKSNCIKVINIPVFITIIEIPEETKVEQFVFEMSAVCVNA